MKTASIARRRGFSLVDLLLVVAAGIGIAFVLLPQLARSRARGSRIGCTNNLKQIGLAFRIWAGDNQDKFPAQVSVTNGGVMELGATGSVGEIFLALSNELNTPKLLLCPEENSRTRQMANTFARPGPAVQFPAGIVPFAATNTLSYFAGLDADPANPNRWLAGDDHFLVNQSRVPPGLLALATNSAVAWRNERHRQYGNLGLADGAVMSVSSARFQDYLGRTGLATNRLALP